MQTQRRSAGGIVALVLVVAVVAGIAWIAFGVLKSSEVYKDAVQKVRANALVQQALGTPIETGFYVTGSMRTQGLSGQATLTIPIHGPKAKATIYVDALRQAGDWTYWTLVVDIKSKGQRINLLK